MQLWCFTIFFPCLISFVFTAISSILNVALPLPASFHSYISQSYVEIAANDLIIVSKIVAACYSLCS